MQDILEILKYILPSLVVFGASYYIMKLFIENESRKRLLTLKLENNKMITPIRLQAYERLILFLERISPSNLIMRTFNNNLSANDFQARLITTIRDEFEHNLSQQIFISEQAWEMVKKAKEETVKLVHTSSAQLSTQSNSQDLSQIIIQKSLEFSELPTHKAIGVLKKEIAQLF